MGRQKKKERRVTLPRSPPVALGEYHPTVTSQGNRIAALVPVLRYSIRITSLHGQEMLWEYYLLQDRVLTHDQATSRES